MAEGGWKSYVRLYDADVLDTRLVNPPKRSDLKRKQTFEDEMPHSSKSPKLMMLKQSDPKKIQDYISKFYLTVVTVDKNDKKECTSVVWDVMETLIDHVREQDGGYIYSRNIEKAGSYAYNTKVGQANEFDWIVPLNAEVKKDEMSFPQQPKFGFNEPESILKDMTKEVKVTEYPSDPGSHDYPHQYYMVVSNKGLPANFIFEASNGRYLISRYVKQDLHRKIKKAIREFKHEFAEIAGVKDITLSNEAHGPALTLKISRGDRQHSISVDITVSLPTDHEVTVHGWPRRATRAAFPKEHIEKALNAGMHFVPKKAIEFELSYSKVERALLQGIDSDNFYAKRCHKVIKECVKDFGDAPGISTHIFKHQLLWMIEDHPVEGYWAYDNFGERVMDMLEDCAAKLRSTTLPDFFKTSKNILEGKDPEVLKNLASYLDRKRLELYQV